ncbi:hypothetical protein [Sutcliffiella horikoshii]|uniref:hypothetical protein n=1 Tax=Sutcliffiella horikoshii TaxID=79883 RepID=UPI001CFE2344|nr:hypothetical protein [Sutcliffiella horikoshii]
MAGYRHVLLGMLVILILAGCQEEIKDDALSIMIFSNIPPVYQDDVEKELQKRTEDYPINVELHPLSKEKFAILLSQQAGDLYVTEREYVEALAGKSGLEPLEISVENSDVEMLMDEQKFFGATLPPGLIPYNQTQQTLVAFIPSFSDKKETSMEVLRNLLDKEE